MLTNTQQKKTSLNDIVGVYELDSITMDSYAPNVRQQTENLPTPPTIHIKSDGRFTATNFPYFSQTKQVFEYRFEGFRNLDTTWEATTVGCVNDDSGHIKNHQGIHLANLPEAINSPGFLGKKKVKGLIFSFGDPDSGFAVIYKKVQK